MQPKQSDPWQREAVKVQLLQKGEDRQTARKIRSAAPQPLAAKGTALT